MTSPYQTALDNFRIVLWQGNAHTLRDEQVMQAAFAAGWEAARILSRVETAAADTDRREGGSAW